MTCAPRACPRRTAKRMRPSLVPSAQQSARARPSSPVPPPQRPFRRQCRSAASRTAGTSCRRQQPTGDSSSSVPGKVQEGTAVPSRFPPPSAGKNKDHFPRRHVRRGKFFSGRKCGPWPPTAAMVCAQPACPSIRRDRQSRSLRGTPRPNVPRYIWANSL